MKNELSWLLFDILVLPVLLILFMFTPVLKKKEVKIEN